MKKKLLITMIACITAMTSMAQSKSYRGFVEGGYGAFVGSKTGSVLSLSTSHGKMFGPIFVGGGIGIEQAWVNNESYIEGYISESGWDGWILSRVMWLPIFPNWRRGTRMIWASMCCAATESTIRLEIIRSNLLSRVS